MAKKIRCPAADDLFRVSKETLWGRGDRRFRSPLLSMVVMTAVAMPLALLPMGTAYAGLPLLFGSAKVPDGASQNGCDDKNKHNIHSYAFLAAVRAYSPFSFRLVLRIMAVSTPTKTATTARPQRAAVTFRVAGAVIRVPTV